MSHYSIKSLEEYFQTYRKSVNNPASFWEEIAEEHFLWRKRWDSVLQWDFHKPEVKWFDGAVLNITENCLDRHLTTKAEQTAVLFEPNDPQEATQHITYRQLHQRVCATANVLKKMGIAKGDRVCLYLPMIPELLISMLACARIGAIHSVIFAGYSAQAIASRVNDAGCRLVVTADGGFRGDRILELKPIVDEALQMCPTVENVLVVKRAAQQLSGWRDGRDHWLQPLLDAASDDCPAEQMQAEDPLFILYTSGSTGNPKGMVHTSGGYMVYTAYTFKNVFQYRDGDVYWCTADIGWITGHSYVVYGPLLNGATTVMFEGVPTYPDAGRFWQIVQAHGINQFYTAPTAVRALAKHGAEIPGQYDLRSLRVLGTAGEPINEEAWHWYDNHVGGGNCPIVDTWWQTETGGIMLTPIPYITPTRPTYATLPFIGIQPALVDEQGESLGEGRKTSGNLCMRHPWPSMARTIWGNHQRYADTYFNVYPGMYFTGDGAVRDEVGYYRITGRVDDVVVVSGHNMGTAPIENAINEHQAIVESAVVGYPHEVKGNALCGYLIIKDEGDYRLRGNLRKEVNQLISDKIGPIAKLDRIYFVQALPKTRSGKIMRRVLRKIACGEADSLGDTSTLVNPESIAEIEAVQAQEGE